MTGVPTRSADATHLSTAVQPTNGMTTSTALVIKTSSAAMRRPTSTPTKITRCVNALTMLSAVQEMTGPTTKTALAKRTRTPTTAALQTLSGRQTVEESSAAVRRATHSAATLQLTLIASAASVTTPAMRMRVLAARTVLNPSESTAIAGCRMNAHLLIIPAN